MTGCLRALCLVGDYCSERVESPLLNQFIVSIGNQNSL